MLNNKKESKIIGYLFNVNPIQDGHFQGCSRMLTAFCAPVLESLKIFLINLVIILMMPAKLATPGLLEIMVFRNKGYEVIIYVDDVTKKFYHTIQIILQMRSCDQSYLKGNSKISMREVITISIL